MSSGEMNRPVEHVVDISPDGHFRVTGDGEGFVSFILSEPEEGAVETYLSRREVNALIGALQNAVTFEWE